MHKNASTQRNQNQSKSSLLERGDLIMLAVENLKVHFDVKDNRGVKTKLRAVDGVSLHLKKGEAYGIVGESGSGKSTIGKALLNLAPKTEGKIEIDGRDITTTNRANEAWLRQHAQIVFQDPHSALNPRMTIMRSVAEPIIVHTKTRGHDLRRRVEELLDIVGLSKQFIYRYPHELSGGQKQRVCIARAIALEPSLLILDEPTSALDVSVQSQILEFLASLQRDLNLTYLFISHNLSVVRYLCQRVGVMYLGNIIEEGTTKTVFEHPRHPYTKALLGAIPYPRATQPQSAPPLIGDIPSPVDLPVGCRFHTRCPVKVANLCDRLAPEHHHQMSGWASCHLLDPDLDKVAGKPE